MLIVDTFDVNVTKRLDPPPTAWQITFMFSPSKYGPTKVFLSAHFSSNIVTCLGWTITFRFTKLLLDGASRKSTLHLKTQPYTFPLLVKFQFEYLTCIDLTPWRQHLWQQDMMWLYPWSGKLPELRSDLDWTKFVQMIDLSAHSHQH